MLHALFGVDTYEDFSTSITADPQDVKRYDSNTNEGPNPRNLKIDFKGSIHSAWNTNVVRHLTDYAIKRLQWIPDIQDLPKRSRAYIDDVIFNYISRVGTVWQQVQPKLLNTGVVETPNELEVRLAKTKDNDAKKGRAYARRHQVRHLFK